MTPWFAPESWYSIDRLSLFNAVIHIRRGRKRKVKHKPVTEPRSPEPKPNALPTKPPIKVTVKQKVSLATRLF